MALEIRPYREEEADAYFRVPGIVFGSYRLEPRQRPEMAEIPPDWSLCVFEDGVLATTYATFPFAMRLNGRKASAAGVTMVGTLPWFRRRGHLRKIMEFDFKRRYEQRMEPVAVLLASIAAIYQRYGYAVCSSRQSYSIDPKLIAFAPSLPPAHGRWREGTRDELPLLDSLYRQFSHDRNGYLHRAPAIWEGQVLGIGGNAIAADAGPSLVAIYEEDGAPKGYVTYAAKEYGMHPDGAGGGQRIIIRDAAWLTPSAYRAIWEHFSSFDLAQRIWWDRAPADDPAFDILLDPRELHATRGDWLLGRIIDVERALLARPYGHEATLTFEVRDSMCPWNEGRWTLEAGQAESSVRRSSESPQLTFDISTLAQLLFGEVSPTNAMRCGRAEASPDASLPLWDAVFRTGYAPFCPDMF